MQINRISAYDSKSQTQNFKGYVGKSVFNFMNDIKSDVAKTKFKDEISLFLELMPDSITKLNNFMKGFHKDTSLEFKSVFKIDKLSIVPFFKNKKTKTEFNAFRGDMYDKYEFGVGSKGININKICVCEKKCDLFGNFPRWNSKAITSLNGYVDELTKTIEDPKVVDTKLFSIMIDNMEETANLPMAKIFGDFLAKRNGNKADKLALEFGFEPIYTKSFFEMANKTREEEKLSIIEKNSLKNLLKDLKKLNLK